MILTGYLDRNGRQHRRTQNDCNESSKGGAQQSTDCGRIVAFSRHYFIGSSLEVKVMNVRAM